MAVPSPHSAPTMAAMANTASHPPPRGRECGYLCCLLTCVVVLFFLGCFGLFLIAPRHPNMKVADLSVSNLSAATSTGATWKAAVLVEWPFYGRSLFREVEVFIYHHRDTAQALAVWSGEPFELRSDASTVIKANMTTTGRAEAEVAEDMDRERRSVGTVIIGLGLRMRITFLYRSWWKKSYGRVQARCDNLRIVFTNSTVDEGGLVTRDDPVTGQKAPASNLPTCTIG